MLRKLILHNFKSITSALIDFSNFTFVVGKNGSGKSNIADALAFVSEATEWPLQMVFNRRGGPLSVARKRPIGLDRSPIEFGISVECDGLRAWRPDNRHSNARAKYAFLLSIGRFGFEVLREQCVIHHDDGSTVWFDRVGPKLSSSVEFLNGDQFPFLSRDVLSMPFVGGILDFGIVAQALQSMAVYSIDPEKLREFQNPDDGRRLLTDGSNAASVLRRVEIDSIEYRRLFEILSAVIPDLERVRPQTIGRKQHLRFTQKFSPSERIAFDAFHMSDGTLRAFGILLALFQRQRPNLLVIEEPETSLHPAATAAVIETLRQESERTQIIITTHSPEVLDQAHAEEDNFKVVTWEDGQSKIGNVEGAAKSALQQHIASAGELLRMRILDAPPLFDELKEENMQQVLFEEFSDNTADS